MTDGKDKLKGYLRLTGLPDLFALPGDAAAGFLLAGGTISSRMDVFRLISVALALVFAEIAVQIWRSLRQLEKDCMEHPEKPIPSGAVPPKAASALLICSFVLMTVFALPGAAAVLTVWAIAALGMQQEKKWYTAGCPILLRIATGVVLVLPQIHTVPLICTAVFAAGMYLFAAGRERTLEVQTTPPPRRGRKVQFAGAVISYGTLFGMVIRTPTQDWHSLGCGAVSAVTAGVFLVLAYWAFRLFQYPVAQIQVIRTGVLTGWAVIFLQAAAVSAKGIMSAALILTGFAILSRFAAKKLEYTRS